MIEFGTWYTDSLSRMIGDGSEASALVADVVTEHTMSAGLGPSEDGAAELVVRVSVWPSNSLEDEIEHFYPGATVDEFGMVSGGWPTDEELLENRRPHGRRTLGATVKGWLSR